MQIIRANPIIAAVLGGLVLVSLLVLLLNDDDSEGPRIPSSDATPATTAAGGTSTPPVTTDEFVRPNIDSLECRDLLSSDDIQSALGDPSSWGQISRGETCTSDFGDRYIQISPGQPQDFYPGTTLFNVIGLPVTDVAARALWFGGPDAEGGGTVGVLVVATESDLGALIFRIVVGRPDLTPDGQLAIARTLAASALTRFPGLEDEPATVPRADEALELAFQEEPPPDRSGISYVDNLLAREADGEWTRGEGLRATLQLFTGQADAADVLRQGEVDEREATGIVLMANDYLEDETNDPALRAEVAELLDAAVYTNDELEAMAGIAPASSRAGATQLISLNAAQQPVELCGNFFDIYTIPGVGPCLEWRPADTESGQPNRYRVFIPTPDLPQAGWTEADYDLAVEALKFSAAWFEGHGKLPPINLVFSVSAGAPALAQAAPVSGKTCGVVLYPALQAEPPGAFEQVIAHELAHCFQTETFPAQNFNYDITRWREEGLADHLSNDVYPDINYEWESVSKWLHVSRTDNTVLDLAYANTLFFQFLENEIGLNGIFGLVRALPTDGGRDKQEAALAGASNMKQRYQEFAEAMIDGTIKDTGGGQVPFELLYPEVQLDGPSTRELEFKPFGIGRIRFTVAECKRAHFSFEPDPISESARPLADEAWGTLPTTLGEGDDDDRLFVISSIEAANVTLDVTNVDDDPECDEDSPRMDTPGPPCGLCPGTLYFWDWDLVTIN